MKSVGGYIVAMVFAVVTAPAASLQSQPAPAATGNRTDVYHVHFTKAVPGQAEALGKALSAPVANAPMPDHVVVLRHQEGDAWDYAVIQHLGPKAEVTAAAAPPTAARDLRAWHNDTFVSGPSWAEFTKAMGIGESPVTGAVYTVGVHRPVPGHRDQLEKILGQPAPSSSKVQTGNLLLQHLEGGDWIFMTVTRYNSWQDFATDRAGAAAGGAGGWADVRQHSDFHRDTIADRIFPK